MDRTRSIVYVVDDDTHVCKAICRLIHSAGFKVKGFSCASDFLASELPEQMKAACLILDVQMPEISGLELQKKLSQMNWKIPIVMMTGYVEHKNVRQKALEAGAISFLFKPFDDTELLSVVRDALGG